MSVVMSFLYSCRINWFFSLGSPVLPTMVCTNFSTKDHTLKHNRPDKNIAKKIREKKNILSLGELYLKCIVLVLMLVETIVNNIEV